jgi:hypothetical protein
MILISEAEFNKRFRVQVGIPPGGRLIKGQSRKMVKKKNQEGRILKKYVLFFNKKRYGYQLAARKLQVKANGQGRRMVAQRILAGNSQPKIIRGQQEQMRKFEALQGARTALRAEARSLIDWSKKFDDFIGKLKSKVKVLSAGLKVYSIKMYFDYDAYRFSKVMSTGNLFGRINIFAMEYDFLHDGTLLRGASNILALVVSSNLLIFLSFMF